MVTIAEKESDVTLENQGSDGNPPKARKIGPDTRYETCSERLSPFGGLLGLIKFLSLFRFEAIFEEFYLPPARKPALGHYRYNVRPKDTIACNDCTYQPKEWDQAYRFVAMRIPVEETKAASESEKQQLPLVRTDK